MVYPKKSEDEKYLRQNISFPPDLHKRLLKFCQEEERSMSWCVQKSLDEWLKRRGF